MLTTPSAFSAFQNRLGAECHIIVKLTDGTSTWYFSDTEMNISEGHVYSILSDISGISESIDIYTKKWAVSDVSVTILNLPYRKNASNEDVRFSDEIANLQNHAIDIYFACGTRITQISDCLHRFSGMVNDEPTYDYDSVSIRANDDGYLLNKILPTIRLESTYLSCPKEIKDNKIPIVYGEFTFDIDSPYTGTGMARGLPTTQGSLPKYVFSDHVLNAITGLYLSPIRLLPFKFESTTLTANDSGYGTGQGTAAVVFGHYSPNGYDKYDYNMSSRPDPTDPGNAYDFDSATYARIYDYDDDGTNLYGEGAFSFAEDVESEIDAIVRHNDEVNAAVFNLYIRYKATVQSGITNSDSSAKLYYEKNGGTDNWTSSDLLSALTLDTSFHDTVLYDFTYTDKNNHYVIALYIKDDNHGNSTTEDQLMLNIYAIMLKVGYALTDGGAYPTVLDNKGRNVSEDLAWAPCEGREFGSWITESSRSVGGYSSGDCIVNPEFIVESILRDELGLTTSQIDTDSFDAAYNSSVEARLNVIEDESAYDIIRRLCEQSTFAFCYSAVSQARLIALNQSSPTTDRTIPASHIVPIADDGPPDIQISKTSVFCNSMKLSSRWQAEYDVFRDYDLVENSTSKTAHGTKEGTYKWPNIAGAHADHVSAHLISNSDGLWSTAHNMIKFATVSFTNADLEVGDWIELDDTTVDPHITLYGSSWSGEQFLVTEVTQYHDKTEITAIQI